LAERFVPFEGFKQGYPLRVNFNDFFSEHGQNTEHMGTAGMGVR
jgi:hypothetical protein